MPPWLISVVALAGIGALNLVLRFALALVLLRVQGTIRELPNFFGWKPPAGRKRLRPRR